MQLKFFCLFGLKETLILITFFRFAALPSLNWIFNFKFCLFISHQIRVSSVSSMHTEHWIHFQMKKIKREKEEKHWNTNGPCNKFIILIMQMQKYDDDASLQRLWVQTTCITEWERNMKKRDENRKFILLNKQTDGDLNIKHSTEINEIN